MVIDVVEYVVDSCTAVFPRKKPNKLAFEQLKLIAHRGAHDKHCIENTLAAFDNALALKCWGIEFDIQSTADGVIVVNHDATLDRIWHHKGVISELSFKQLRALVPQIPRLIDVVERYGHRLHLLIEFKAAFNNYHSLMSILAPLTAIADYHLLSLDETIFTTLKPFIPKAAMLLVANYHNVSYFCQQSLTQGYGGVMGHYLLVTNRHINRLQSIDQQVGVGFVNSKYSLYRELNRGLSWIFSNQVKAISHCCQHPM